MKISMQIFEIILSASNDEKSSDTILVTERRYADLPVLYEWRLELNFIKLSLGWELSSDNVVILFKLIFV